MNWTRLLKMEMESTYRMTAQLLDRVKDENLEWKPATGANWMTVGQLIRHIATACGWGCRGFVTGEWGLPEGKTWADLTPEENLPPAEKMPASASVAEAKRMARGGPRTGFDHGGPRGRGTAGPGGGTDAVGSRREAGPGPADAADGAASRPAQEPAVLLPKARRRAG